MRYKIGDIVFAKVDGFDVWGRVYGVSSDGGVHLGGVGVSDEGESYLLDNSIHPIKVDDIDHDTTQKYGAQVEKHLKKCKRDVAASQLEVVDSIGDWMDNSCGEPCCFETGDVVCYRFGNLLGWGIVKSVIESECGPTKYEVLTPYTPSFKYSGMAKIEIYQGNIDIPMTLKGEAEIGKMLSVYIDKLNDIADSTVSEIAKIMYSEEECSHA